MCSSKNRTMSLGCVNRMKMNLKGMYYDSIKVRDTVLLTEESSVNSMTRCDFEWESDFLKFD